MLADWGDAEKKLTDRVSVLVGTSKGSYPSGNSVIVKGTSESIVIDPSIDVVHRGGVPVAIDAVLNSHSHEDHMPGNGFFADARVHIHEADLIGAQSLEGLMEVFGFRSAQTRKAFERVVVEEFHFSPRPDAQGFSDGDVFDLGGIHVEAVHLPGHTRGHSGFRISEDVFFLSDIDLTGFGPYYGDGWSDLDDFEESLRKVREEEAAWYVTFHHKGVIHGSRNFRLRVDEFAAVIDRRHDAMLDFMSEPRSLEDLVGHRFIYRPHVDNMLVMHVESRSADLHLARMLERGEASEVEPGRYRAIRA
jgi:glyoxylase-like metal-dependent hydrolase (beta-lactamase superfamily II)